MHIYTKAFEPNSYMILFGIFSFFHQVAHDLLAPDCEAFVQLGSSTICDITEAVSLIKQAENMYVSSSNAQVSDA